MAGLLSSLFGGQSHADSPYSGPDSNKATVSVEDVQKGGEAETHDDEGFQGAQSFEPSINDPSDGGAGDTSPIGPPTDAYLESQ
ncbi:hypothetical protein [Sphingomonas soli]|uniref:hypothetical protein n=1 Tax=Sphingomonas soli TaxID=266127 RepID=UPI000834DEAB|nr:hypothetical protein [Sphingomonas soli]